jgi:putative ABC transport system ATP-binding protein
LNEEIYLRFKNIHKTYSEGNVTRHVLRGASAEFACGEFVAILGKSGSGKSTLLNIISGIDQLDQGEIWFSNQQLSSLSDRDRTLFRRKNIGFVFQFFNLIPTLTVWENVVLPLELNGKFDDHGSVIAEGLLSKVGLLDRKDTFPDRLSGGEQQRVAIARALVHDPLLVLADEPTGNLDDATGKNILVILDQLTRKAGKNLILVTHNPEAANYADRTIYLKDGQFVPLDEY